MKGLCSRIILFGSNISLEVAMLIGVIQTQHFILAQNFTLFFALLSNLMWFPISNFLYRLPLRKKCLRGTLMTFKRDTK